MLIVGVDFGTTNVRVATWDKDVPNTVPESQTVASGDSKIMPSVVAFQRNPDGDVELAVGEEADNMNNSADVLVVPNIKRWAMSSDVYMRWHMKERAVEWLTWWDPDNRTVNVWGKVFPVKDIIRAILKRAFDVARIGGEFEWRAGCPVHAGLDYRSDLSQALSELAGQGNINWLVEEPLLLLALGHRALPNSEGSYLVYDLGGGSFDSTMAQVQEGGELVVYGADGHPLVGGANIDRLLEEKLEKKGFTGSQTDIRIAKESLSPSESSRDLTGGISLAWDEVQDTLYGGRFLRQTSIATRDAYVSAKGLQSEIAESYVDTGEVKFVWQLSYKDMAEQIDHIVLYGGAIKIGGGYFIDKLRGVFGGKTLTASEWLQDTNIPDAELLGISLGACYFADKDHFVGKGFSAFLKRLPVRIVLQNLRTSESVGYEPFDHLTLPNNPFSEFATKPLVQERDEPQEYELTATTLDGVVVERHSIDGYLEPGNRQPATSLRMIITRLGSVLLEKRSEGVGLPWTKTFQVIDSLFDKLNLPLPQGEVGQGIITSTRDPEYYEKEAARQRDAARMSANQDAREALKYTR